MITINCPNGKYKSVYIIKWCPLTAFISLLNTKEYTTSQNIPRNTALVFPSCISTPGFARRTKKKKTRSKCFQNIIKLWVLWLSLLTWWNNCFTAFVLIVLLSSILVLLRQKLCFPFHGNDWKFLLKTSLRPFYHLSLTYIAKTR